MSSVSSVQSDGTSLTHPALASIIRPYSRFPFPAWGLAGLFLASSVIPPRPTIPPIMHRIGFGVIFLGAGYVLSTGDARNGSGITTAWSLTYLFLNLRKSLTPPRNFLSLTLTMATMASSTLLDCDITRIWY
ncbi:hypothetical protein AcW1_005139 [Taiwanofungus camphoratus]|nr:hypothetical protein AcV5_001505 [Antrodia cinnamomea]KAI0941030.1 hypothetical protein AcV7_002694 [Antrodia cinnamomea]KAI0960690.1 hypothetical protein AcW1_005139 [Antrodia cinnamomea]